MDISARQSPAVVTSILVFITLLLTACGGGSDGKSDENVVSRVAIEQGSVLLTGINETKTLSAKAFNAAGEEVDAEITWSSSNTDSITISSKADQQATITSQISAGSTQLIAQAQGVSSAPIVALVAMTVANALIVTDEQIIVEPVPVDANAPWSLGYQYTVTLQGLNPQVGDILIGSEEIPLAGRVVDVMPSGNNAIVTLEMVTIAELFTEIIIEENLPLRLEPEHISVEASEYYNVEKQDDGSLLFSLKPDLKTAATQAKGEFAIGGPIGTTIDTDNIYLGPFKCPIGDLTPTNGMISLPSLMPSMPLQNGLNFVFKYDSNTDYFIMALQGDAKVEFKIAPTLNVQIESKLACKMPLVEIPVPTLPGLQFILGAEVPLGIGFEIGGKLDITGVGAEIKTEVKAIANLGIECPISAECGMLNTLDWESEADFNLIIPGDDIIDTLKLEPAAGGFIFAQIEVGNPIFDELQWGILELKAGLNQSASLASIKGQILDADYNSDYKLSVDLSAGLAPDALVPINFLADIGVINNAVNQVAISYAQPLYTSPQSTMVTADVSSFEIGDTVNFDLTLNPGTLEYLLLPLPQGDLSIDYNVDEIVLYRKEDFGSDFDPVEIARVGASDGQTEFSIPWEADFTGSIGENFYAFVSTKAWPLPVLDELELAKVTGTSVESSVALREVGWGASCTVELSTVDDDVSQADSDGDTVMDVAALSYSGGGSCSESASLNVLGGSSTASVSIMTSALTTQPGELEQIVVNAAGTGQANLSGLSNAPDGDDDGIVFGDANVRTIWDFSISRRRAFTLDMSISGFAFVRLGRSGEPLTLYSSSDTVMGILEAGSYSFRAGFEDGGGQEENGSSSGSSSLDVSLTLSDPS